MPLAYLLDEGLRGVLWRTVQRHNLVASEPLDLVRVGDLPDLPLGTLDPAILMWTERAGRILISRDRTTLGVHLLQHLQARHRSPGIFLLRRRCALPQVVAFLVEAAYRSDPLSWQNRIEYIP